MIKMKNYSRQYILIAFLFLMGFECLSQNRIKKTDYEYDLISGNVKQVTYQAGRPDTYVQQYTYDADNRITEARSSNDGVIFNRDAVYTYYQHGPLARTLLGDNKVQGLDYTYTLQGWIKGVNSNVMDMVKDPGKDGQLSTKTGRDVFSYSLGYYNGDYASIAGSMQFLATVNSSNLDAANSGLFNGNIRHMVTSLTDNTGVQMEGQGYAYRYDQLNRIKKSEMFLLNKTTNNFGTGPSALYKETFAYDANGNISGLIRNGNNSTSPQMDQLSYVYAQEGGEKLNNRLLHVDDGIEEGRYAIDIDDQGVFVSNDPATWNYQYDAIGNLIKDKQESIEEITWTVTGKIKSIHRVSGSTLPDLEFKYDGLGHRIAKIEKPSGHLNTPSQWTYTYYVLDAKGNTLAVYIKKPEGGEQRIKLKDQYLYGAKRLGNIQRDVDVTNPIAPLPPDAILSFERVLGKKQYELTNHLGNVLEVITDKRNAHRTASGTVDYYQAQVVSATDYYAFGSPMPGRDFNSVDYRYGFNGKENDKEVIKTGHGTQDYGMRIYNPSLGRFLSVDPLFKDFAWNSVYSFAENGPLENIDLDGLERYHYTRTKDDNGKTVLTFLKQEDIVREVYAIAPGVGIPSVISATEVNGNQEFVVHQEDVSTFSNPYTSWDIPYDETVTFSSYEEAENSTDEDYIGTSEDWIARGGQVINFIINSRRNHEISHSPKGNGGFKGSSGIPKNIPPPSRNAQPTANTTAKQPKNSGNTIEVIKKVKGGAQGEAVKVTLVIPEGYTVVKGLYSEKQLVFTNGKNWISADVTDHKGGVWKMFNNIKNVGSTDKSKRAGTYNEDLSVKVDD